MAHLPLSKAERALCFVPAAKQFERARELRAKLHSPVLALPSAPVQEQQAEAAPAYPQFETFDDLIAELESLDTGGMKPIPSSPKGHVIAKRLMRLCEEKHSLSRGDIVSSRRTSVFVVARDELINALASLSDWSLPMIGRFVKRNHTTVLHAIQKHATDPKQAAAYAARKERSRAAVGRRIADRALILPKGPRWTPKKDAAIISMLASGMSHRQIAANLTGKHSINSVHGRVKRLRDWGMI